MTVPACTELSTSCKLSVLQGPLLCGESADDDMNCAHGVFEGRACTNGWLL